jgi:DNA-binding PadR family transcriptional regulator
MPRPPGSMGAPPPGLLGLYALAMMEKEGQVHGYRVADRISERTEGAWRPGPGAIYPSLQKLVARGWARARPAGRRREYEITRSGRRVLAQLRSRHSTAGVGPDTSVLWAELVGSADLESFLLLRLRRTLDLITRRLDHPQLSREQTSALRRDVAHELEGALERLQSPAAVPLPALVRRKDIRR